MSEANGGGCVAPKRKNREAVATRNKSQVQELQINGQHTGRHLRASAVQQWCGNVPRGAAMVATTTQAPMKANLARARGMKDQKLNSSIMKSPSQLFEDEIDVTGEGLKSEPLQLCELSNRTARSFMQRSHPNA